MTTPHIFIPEIPDFGLGLPYVTFGFEAHRCSTTGKIELVSLKAEYESDGHEPLHITDVTEAFNNGPLPKTGFAYQGAFELRRPFSASDPVVHALVAMGFDADEIITKCAVTYEAALNARNDGGAHG